MKTTPCNIIRSYAFDKAPRCNAPTRTNNGNPCQSPAVRGSLRCRMHGETKGKGAPHGNRNALKHGYFTKESKTLRKAVKTALKRAEQFSAYFEI